MQLRGRVFGVLRDVEGNAIISFNVGKNLPQMANIEGKDLDIKVFQHREKRSLDANALMWHCIGEIAKSLNPPRDKWEIYIESLRKYGKYTYVLLSEKAVETFKQLWRETEVVGEVDVNGRKAVQLLCYYGSSTYDTKEFSVLLDGIIEDMKDLGLNPPLPSDIKRSLETWEKMHERSK